MKQLTVAEIAAQSAPGDWRVVDDANTLYMELEKGRIVMELAPQFAPKHAANIKALVREKYFDGLSIMRSHDNYVVQWGDPTEKREVKTASKTLKEEFSIAYDKNFSFTRLRDGDVYAPEVGHSNSFPAARNPKQRRTWLAHCYGMVGAGRDNDADSGGGTELYVVIGHAPRNLDRNVTLVGRVLRGMELLSAFPRGTADLGFYDKPEQFVSIKSIRIAADLPVEQRTKLEVIRTDTATYQAMLNARRNPSSEWYKFASGHVDLCNAPLIVRERKGS